VSEATSRVADATAAVAGGVVGAAVKGVIGGIQGAANGIRDGRRKGNQSVAGRQGAAWSLVSSAIFREPPTEYATGGA
jgi:hypothetical protein